MQAVARRSFFKLYFINITSIFHGRGGMPWLEQQKLHAKP